ncbi:arylsulfatase B-like isoform X2 [Clavelina lepadiformis]
MYTPFLDSLAEKGVKLENYYVQPICSPTRGQLLSGRYQIHTGLMHGVLKGTQAHGFPLDNILLPEQLRNCGYKTHMLGKWHLGFHKDEYLPWNRGFQSFFGFLTGGENYYTKHKCEPKKTRKYCGVDMYDSRRGPTNSTWGVYSTDVYIRKAKQIISAHRKTNKPLFLYLALQSVHGPLQMPPQRSRRFRDIKDRDRRVYGSMVLAMDRALKRLSQHLKHARMWKDTIFIFSTDNGGQVKRGGNNWPLRGSKGTLWEGGVKAVGFIHGKFLGLQSSNVVNRELIHVSDWLPTIMSATKCPIMTGTKPLDGYDQWDAIRGLSRSKRTEILHNIDPLFNKKKLNVTPDIRHGFDVSIRAGIRSGKWKLLTGIPGMDLWVRPPECDCYNKSELNFKPQNNPTQNVKLFDIENDPNETAEVSKFHPEVVELLLSRLVEYNASAVPAVYPPNRRLVDPKLHGGFWVPWKNKPQKQGRIEKKSHKYGPRNHAPDSAQKFKAGKFETFKDLFWEKKSHKRRLVKLF